MDFLLEIEGLLANWEGPTVIGGDFNIVTTAKEKSNGNINQKWANMLLEVINKWSLIELKNCSRTYTWTNNQELPIMAALARCPVPLPLSRNILWLM